MSRLFSTGGVFALDFAIFLLVRLGREPGCFLLCPKGVVVRAQSKLVFVDSAITLAGDVKDLSEVDMRPDISPFRVEIPVDCGTEFVGRRLIIALF